MSQPVITVKHVSKRFTLNPERARSFQSLFVGAFRHRRDTESQKPLWGLQDVSFQLDKGEAVALIGQNGSGKSTCLKLLSRIMTPTSGSIAVQGRISALLELGAGFQPELTGRENIYLYGAILGMSKDELKKRFDEIISFAELERYVDVPVKTYSSGMYVRLGFATAVSVEPDVLLIDEVLAVGDQSFQEKCLRRVRQMQREGVTIVFVSHDLASVRSLCQRALWFEGGKLRSDGPVEAVIDDYTAFLIDEGLIEPPQPDQPAQPQTGQTAPGEGENPPADEHSTLVSRRRGSLAARIVQVRLLDEQGTPTWAPQARRPCTLELTYQADERIPEPVFGYGIHTRTGLHVTGTNTHLDGYQVPPIEGGGLVTFSLPDLNLGPGNYMLSVALHSRDEREAYDYQDFTYPFSVVGSRDEAKGEGLTFIPGTWRHRLASVAKDGSQGERS